MTPQKRLNPLTTLGLVFFILGSLAKLLLHRATHTSQDMADLTTGLLYGLAIGCMLVGIWRSRRRPAV
jgi:peptidoglycan/LPS O-acetylase OafA/YrhL